MWPLRSSNNNTETGAHEEVAKFLEICIGANSQTELFLELRSTLFNRTETLHN